MTDWHERSRHSDGACVELLLSLLPDPAGDGASLLEPGNREPEAVIEILGRALWDIFSNNHSVVDIGGTAYHLGSFRASGDFIARVLNQRYPSTRTYDYLDFYMGSALVSESVDMGPFHRWVFSHLKAAGCRWIYSFPRLHLIDLRGLARTGDDDFGTDPSEAVRRELEDRERREDVEDLSSRLDEAYEAAVRSARHDPLPATVAAHRDVFGVLPEGWPHPDM